MPLKDYFADSYSLLRTKQVNELDKLKDELEDLRQTSSSGIS